MIAGLVLVAPVNADNLTEAQILAFRDSLRHQYVDERRACEIALSTERDTGAWRNTARRWIAYRINRLAGLAVLAVVLLVCVRTASADCGEERAVIKLGLDEEAKRIDTEPVDTTVARLIALPRPGRIPESARASDVERTVWRVEATVTAYKLEGDGDVHLVIVDAGRRMIVELSDPECAAPGAWGEQVRDARAAFLQMLAERGFPAPSRKLHWTSIPVRASGVGFYDRQHGQAGAAPNGLELHPVLSIDLATSS